MGDNKDAIAAAIREHHRQSGRRGGLARVKNATPEQREQSATRAAAARWAKTPRTHWVETPPDVCPRAMDGPAMNQKLDDNTAHAKEITCPVCRKYERSQKKARAHAK